MGAVIDCSHGGHRKAWDGADPTGRNSKGTQRDWQWKAPHDFYFGIQSQPDPDHIQDPNDLFELSCKDIILQT